MNECDAGEAKFDEEQTFKKVCYFSSGIRSTFSPLLFSDILLFDILYSKEVYSDADVPSVVFRDR